MRGREVRHAGPRPRPAGAADGARHARTRQTHNYVRHGTTSLFAAFNIAYGSVISALHRQHRAVEFRKFLVAIDKAVPADLDVHLICDNLATHKTPAIRDWLARHPRFHLHFTPTGSSWINQVERWFGLLTDQLIRRGVHQSVVALAHDVRQWINNWNQTLVVNFVSFWARPAWRTRFGSCVLHDHPAALRSSSSPRAGRRLELDVCGAAAVATAGAAGRRGGRGDVWRET